MWYLQFYQLDAISTEYVVTKFNVRPRVKLLTSSFKSVKFVSSSDATTTGGTWPPQSGTVRFLLCIICLASTITTIATLKFALIMYWCIIPKKKRAVRMNLHSIQFSKRRALEDAVDTWRSNLGCLMPFPFTEGSRSFLVLTISTNVGVKVSQVAASFEKTN